MCYDTTRYIKRDEKQRIIFASFSDGYSFERTFDENYKNGEIPYYVIEYENGKKVYEREGDVILFET